MATKVEENYYIGDVFDFDQKLAGELKVVSGVERLMKDLSKPKEEWVEEFTALTAERDKFREEKTPLEWDFVVHVFVIDDETKRYVFDEYIISHKRKMLLQVNNGKKIDDLKNIRKMIREEKLKLCDEYFKTTIGKYIHEDISKIKGKQAPAKLVF